MIIFTPCTLSLFLHYLFALNGNSIDNLRKKFVTSGGILYKEGVLPQDDLQTIRKEVDALSSSFSPGNLIDIFNYGKGYG